LNNDRRASMMKQLYVPFKILIVYIRNKMINAAQMTVTDASLYT